MNHPELGEEKGEEKKVTLENRESIKHGISALLALAGWALAVWWFVDLSGG